MQEYSAGFTSERLVKNEMKLVIQLYLDGKTKEEIRDLVIDENLFNMRSIASIKETFE
jgi:DNA-dependent RNA polymerase auxiliary subunit epsilon